MLTPPRGQIFTPVVVGVEVGQVGSRVELLPSTGRHLVDDDPGYADILVTKRLTDLQIVEKLPTLGPGIGHERRPLRGKIREYLPL